MSDDEDKPGIWIPKSLAEKYTDDNIARWFLERFLIDCGNSYEYTVTRGGGEGYEV